MYCKIIIPTCKIMPVYRIDYDFGPSRELAFPNTECAKKFATTTLKFESRGINVTEIATGKVWRRDQWRNLNRFGWTKWTLQEVKQ